MILFSFGFSNKGGSVGPSNNFLNRYGLTIFQGYAALNYELYLQLGLQLDIYILVSRHSFPSLEIMNK